MIRTLSKQIISESHINSVYCISIAEFRVRRWSAREPHLLPERRRERFLGLPNAGNQTGNGIDGSTALALEKTLPYSEFRSYWLSQGGYRMNRKLLLILALIAALVISACGAPAADTGGGETARPQPRKRAAPSGTGVAEFHPAWPYAPPPTGHFNTWVTNGMTLGIYRALMEPPLFMFLWADGSWMPVAGEAWEWVDDVTLRVSLIRGANWSDGSAFTSQDVVDTFSISRLLSQTVWRFLDDVQAVRRSHGRLHSQRAFHNGAPPGSARDAHHRLLSLWRLRPAHPRPGRGRHDQRGRRLEAVAAGVQ